MSPHPAGRNAGPLLHPLLPCSKCKLYRFDNDNGEWKERGVGQGRILQHKVRAGSSSGCEGGQGSGCEGGQGSGCVGGQGWRTGEGL